MKEKKEKKSKLSPKAQKIVDTISTVVEIILIAVCLVISIFVIANPGGVKDDDSSSNGYSGNVNLVPVLSNSMDPTFKKNDLIFGQKIKNPSTDIQSVGTIIMFLDTNADGSYYINTHRIIGYSMSFTRTVDGKDMSGGNDMTLSLEALYGTDIDEAADYDVANIKNTSLKDPDALIAYCKSDMGCNSVEITGYITKGDNNSIYPEGVYHDTSYRKLSNTIGTLKLKSNGQPRRIAVLGGVINWMHSPLHFGLIIMIPLVLLFAYNIYIVIKYVMEQKVKKAQAEALASATAAAGQQPLDEEEIKRRAVEEYLAKQAAAQKEEEIKKKAIEEYLAKQAAQQNEEKKDESSDSSENK